MLRDAIRFSTTPLHEFMKAWDSDGSGELDFAEFCGAIGEIACKSGMSGAFFDVNKKELRALFDSFDKDEGGTISFGELLQTINEDLQVGAVAFKLNGRTEGRALRRADDDEAFNRLDADDSGLIDAGELISYYVSQGVDKDEAQLLLTHLDSNSDGKISRQEWREGLASAREMLQGKVKGSLLSSLVLESFVAPVKPPKTELFTDLRPKGQFYDSPCKLPRMEDRAISLQQLAKLRDHISRRCDKERWQTSAPVHASQIETEKALTPQTVTLYDVCAYVLKPATFFHRVSFVEYITEESGPKRPDWFVAHWWGEQFGNSFACLRQHARDRGLDLDGCKYWICAYALNQWTLADIHGLDPLHSPFRRALQMSQGVVAVIDPKAFAFKRVWVCYEVLTLIQLEKAAAAEKEQAGAGSTFLTSGGGDMPADATDGDAAAAEGGGGGSNGAAAGSVASAGGKGSGGTASGGERLKYDIYTVDSSTGRVYGLTDGIAATDKGSASAQARRQAKFPSHIMRAALTARIQDGDATVPSDRRHLLNSIVGLPSDELETPPLEEHHEYHVANQALVAKTVHLCIDVALSQGQVERQKLLLALTRSMLEEFSHCFLHGSSPSRGFSEPVLSELLEALPDTLCKLELVLPFPTLPQSLPNGYAHLVHLLCLNLSDSVYLEVLPDWIIELRNLKHIFLQRCVQLRTLPRKMCELFSAYKDIIIDLTGCAQIFYIEEGVNIKEKNREEGCTPFLSIGALDVVRDFLQKADEAKNDSVRIKDGYGRDIYQSALNSYSSD